MTITNLTAPVFAWSNGSNLEDLSGLTANIYTVTVTGAGGCSATGTYTINPSVPISANISASDPDLCIGESTDLTASGGGVGATYIWSNGDTNTMISTSPNINTTYAVSISDNGCAATAEINIAVYALPDATISGSPSYCLGSSTTLTAPTGLEYLWSNGETTQSLTVNSPNTYSVTVTNTNACTASNSIVVTESIQLNPNVTGGGNICVNETATLNAGIGFSSYLWSNGETTATIVVSNADTYTVTVSDGLCSGTGSSTVTTSSLPTPQIDGTTPICQNGNAILSVSGGTFIAYEWQDGSFSPTFNANASGTYSITVTDVNGCTATDDFTLTIANNPNAAINGISGFCPGSSTTLTATPIGNSYNWSNGATTQDINVNSGGIFEVTVTDSNNCSGTAAINITAYVVDAPTLSDAAICSGETITLNAGAYNAYSWSNGETSASINVISSDNYSVTVTDANNCTAQANANITVNNLPTVSISGATSICPNSTATLNATSGMATYLWNTNDGSITSSPNAESISINAAGTYNVTVSAADGCTGSATFVLIEDSAPAVNISGDSSICVGENTVLDAASGWTWVSYAWSNGATTPTISVTPIVDTPYSVTVSNGNCSSTGSVVVSINALPTADAGIDQSICQGDNATLTASGGTNYQWSNGAGNTASIIVNPATTTIYTVTVSDAAACSATDDVTVIVNNAADAGADNSTTVCDNSGEGTSTVDLSTLVSAAGGVFAPIAGAPALAGTTFDGEGLPTGNYEYSYTVAGIAPCPDDVATISIIVNDCAACPNPPTAGFSYASPFCVGVGTASITLNAGATAGLFTANPAGLSINATTGEVDLVASTAGTYTVTNTVAASGACPQATATANISINSLPTADAGIDQSICQEIM
ncbi:MAG: PKD domain-containing protein [Sphingobacteriales bacterium]|nr:PKD domain-containing protein [Sphingobacteriales bacterium]